MPVALVRVLRALTRNTFYAILSPRTYHIFNAANTSMRSIMLRERVSEDIYLFTSDLYAQVTAGIIVADEGAILVDSLPFPIETQEMASFIPEICPEGVKYVILTHYHADHTYGAFLFPQADVVAHKLCRELLTQRGLPALEEIQTEEPALEGVSLRLPDITFDEDEMGLHLGEKVMRLIHAPGHSKDLIMVYVEEDEVLFASDTVMPVPAIADGDIDAFRSSLKKILTLPPINNMVQGHGEVILVGEVESAVKVCLNYLDTIEEKVSEAIADGTSRETLKQDNIESCGLSRIPLNGQVQNIHVANLLTLYDQMKADGR